MRKAHLVIAALALAASAPASAQSERLPRRHVGTHARRASPPPAPVAPAAPGDAEIGSSIDRATAAIARANAASRAATTDAFAPLLRTIYPPGDSGDL